MSTSSRSWFELDPDSDPPSGRFHDGDRPPRPFTSWLELVTLIEETRARRRKPEPDEPDEPDAPGSPAASP